MKIADNRALVAKKKLYNQPEVEVTQIALESIILAGSCAGGSGAGKVNTGIDTDDQW